MIVQNFEILAMPTNPQSLAMTIIKSFISHKKQTIYNCTQHACKTSKFQQQELCIERKKERWWSEGEGERETKSLDQVNGCWTSSDSKSISYNTFNNNNNNNKHV
jgi:hypothetical protein